MDTRTEQEFDLFGRIILVSVYTVKKQDYCFLQYGQLFVIGGGNKLSKLCKCGNNMNIHIRTVIYKNRIEIDNVPIYTCDSCSVSEVFQPVKSELTNLISQFGAQPEKKQFYFNETSELASLLMTVSLREFMHITVDQMIENRINELLDLLLLARSLQDEFWIEDIMKRLSQITLQSINTYDFT